MTDDDPRLSAWRTCPHESLTLAALAGDVDAEERDFAETHLADCDTCRETAALFARLLADETTEETLVLELFARRTALAARERIRDARADVPVAAPEASRADVWRWVVWMAFAAAVAAVVVAWFTLRT